MRHTSVLYQYRVFKRWPRWYKCPQWHRAPHFEEYLMSKSLTHKNLDNRKVVLWLRKLRYCFHQSLWISRASLRSQNPSPKRTWVLTWPDPKEDQKQVIPVYKFELILFSRHWDCLIARWQTRLTKSLNNDAGLSSPSYRLYTIFPPVTRG